MYGNPHCNDRESRIRKILIIKDTICNLHSQICHTPEYQEIRKKFDNSTMIFCHKTFVNERICIKSSL